jgi:hypothetical protein
MGTLAVGPRVAAAFRNRNDMVETGAEWMRPIETAIDAKAANPTIPFIAFEDFGG